MCILIGLEAGKLYKKQKSGVRSQKVRIKCLN